MSHTVSVRLPEDIARRLDEKARNSGRSRSALVKEALERSLDPDTKPFMALAGSIAGDRDLSERRGFARP